MTFYGLKAHNLGTTYVTIGPLNLLTQATCDNIVCFFAKTLLSIIAMICRQFIKEQFTGQEKKKGKGKEERIYTFETTATDTTLVKNIFVVVKDIIMKINLNESGLEWNLTEQVWIVQI